MASDNVFVVLVECALMSEITGGMFEELPLMSGRRSTGQVWLPTGE